jgi:predicted ArsR family transcriptional regulator
MNQKQRVLTALKSSKMTIKQLATRLKIASPSKVISMLRNDGFNVRSELIASKGQGRPANRYFVAPSARAAKRSTKRASA